MAMTVGRRSPSWSRLSSAWRSSLFAVRDDLAHLGRRGRLRIARHRRVGDRQLRVDARLRVVGVDHRRSRRGRPRARRRHVAPGTGGSARACWASRTCCALPRATSTSSRPTRCRSPRSSWPSDCGPCARRRPGSVRALLPGVALALLPEPAPGARRADQPARAAARHRCRRRPGRRHVAPLAGAVRRRCVRPGAPRAGQRRSAGPRAATLGPHRVSRSACSLAAGITWDDRVRDGRAAIRYVGSMR